MPKPTPRFVKLPEGGEIVPEHFHEGAEGVRRFKEGLKTVLGVSREELNRRQQAWERLQAKKSAKRKHR